MRRPFAVLFALALLSSACHDKRESPEPGPAAPAPAAAVERVTDMDLLALVHLADVQDPRGLFIDFGTAARFKYTNGNWQSGWVDDRIEDDATVSTFQGKAKLFVPADGSARERLRLRIKPYASGRLSVLLNGKKLLETGMEPGAFRELTAAVAPGLTHAGENQLELRSTASTAVGDTRVSGALDWLRLEREASAKAQDAGSPPVEIGRAWSVGGVERNALRLAPGAQLDWFVEIAEHAVLRVDLGSLGENAQKLLLEMSGDETNATRIINVPTRWTSLTVPLADAAGEAIRLRLRNEGTEPLALSALRVEKPAGLPAPASATNAKAKNVVLILVDTLRASKLPLYNPDSRVKTPVLDALAEEAAVFERAQAPENWTKPSVASVLTALYPSSHLAQADAAKLSESVTLISETYRSAGFRTASFVTNSFVSPEFGFDQGWDLNVNMDYLADSNEGKAENVFAAAGKWLTKHGDEPFFLYVQTIDPHAPYDPPSKYLEMYDPQPYDGQVDNQETPALLMQVNRGTVELTERDRERLESLHDGEITYHDAELGKFLAKMKALGLDQSTILVLTSDHGEEFAEHGKWGHGHSMYQELLHVPLLFRWPGVIPPGSSVAPPVSIVDIGPTIFDATGIAEPTESEGNSLMPFMVGDGRRGPHAAFSEWQSLYRAVRTERYKLILHAFFQPELYDLQSDPWETRKLDGKEHPIAQRYARILMGQFLGAPSRRLWLSPSVSGAGSAADEREVETQEMTPELCRQLVALGYVIAECE